MTAMASVSSPWMPEDDLLLKNSIETGASLESLAKGAVKFSRKFTFREIRDRWYSLLYDPDVSAQASAHMAELELSGSSNPPSKLNNTKGNEKLPEKRKNGSIRKQYHARLKRLKTEFFSSQNLGFYEEHTLENKFQDHVTTNHEAPGGNAMLDDCLANNLGFEEKDFEILRQAFPESISIATTTTVANTANAIANPNPFHMEGDLFKFPEERNELMGSFDQNIEMKDATCTSETPLNPKSDNKQEFGGKHHFSSPVSDGSASLWKTLEDVSAPDMPIDDTNQETHQLGNETLPDSDLKTDNKKPNENGFINSTSVHEGEYTDLPDSLLNFSNEDDILFMDVDNVQEVDVSTSSTPTATLAIPSPEEESKDHGADVAAQLTEGQVICTLNTEDPEIPCNDDIFLLIHPSNPFAPSVGGMEVSRDSIGGPLSPSSHEKDGENMIRKGKDPAPCFRSHTGGSEFVSTFKREPPDNEYLVPGQQVNNLRNPSQTRPMHAPLEITANGMEENTSKDEHQGLSSPVLPLEAGPVKTINPESNDESYVSDSDGEIPYFSDVEAMILEMDLTNSQESCLTSEVARYQYEGTKKMIIRLEQAARSSFQRAMSSKGALAVFYGRHLKHYIKKSEVTIGRSTDDTAVDIDLRKEGRANKISRRQAIIKMETDGSFSLKNVGASSISLNGKEVGHGQVVGLSSSCLIEIRGMSFVFEMNEKYVRRYLANQGRVVEEKKV